MSLQNKVLRLFPGPDTGEDWHDRSKGYLKEDVANIKDPAAGARKEITSIPSPFARVHLFENAFESVTAQALKEGYDTLNLLTAYHQLVSDALDVAEIFLNFEVFNETDHNLRFVVWNKEKEIQSLKNNPKHRIFGETLELYLVQDTKKSHFDKIENFYILYCNNQPIGCTSPSTMFFGAHNEAFRLGGLKLGRGDDIFFDEKPFPLYKRSLVFQQYLYFTFILHPELQEAMAPLWGYMQVNLDVLQRERHEDWQTLQNEILNPPYSKKELKAKFESIYKSAVVEGENTNIEIITGIYHRRLPAGLADYKSDSFAIKSDIYNKGKLPLALQNNFAKPLSYCGGKWRPDTVVPYYDERPLERRILPGTAEVYPYFTVSDFLEPYLIQVPYPLDKEYFMAGNPVGFRESDRSIGDKGIPGDDGYLLPLTRIFFDCFGPDFLDGHTPEGKPHFRIAKSEGDSVEVQLLIPIYSGDYVSYKRIYRPGQVADPVKNEGGVVMCRFDIGFFPLMHVDKNVKQFVVLADGDVLSNTKDYEYSLEFYLNNGNIVTPKATDIATRQDKRKHQQYVTTKYYVQNNYYDFVQVSNGKGQQGIIVPKWIAKTPGNKAVKIAIDFGTTNSYMALAFGDQQPQGLEITEKERFLVTLSEHWVSTSPVMIKEAILRTVSPFTLGPNEECLLPMRTVVSEIQGVNYAQVKPGTLVSIPFYFERRSLLKNEDWFSNLKWTKISDKGTANNVRIESYLGMLLFMARNQIILKNGDFEQCKLIWTFPTSLGANSIGMFNKTWKRIVEEYLGMAGTIEQIPESVAPFYAFNENERKSGAYPVVNIDIGGGTTDVIIFRKNEPEYNTSIRFAGNTVFGSGYASYNSKDNGLLRIFQEKFETWINENQGNLYNLTDAYRGETIGVKNMGAADINSFFFSIENNREVRESGLRPISYSDMLSEREDIKVAFLLFYSAVIYHIAFLMKGLNLSQPRKILFSGKGAGIIKLMDTSIDSRNTVQLTKLIFEKVFEAHYHADGLDILIGDAPKEKTCYGAINIIKEGKMPISFKNVVMVNIPSKYTSNTNTDDLSSKPDQERKAFENISNVILIDEKSKDGTEVRYENLQNEAFMASAVAEVKNFIEFFFQINKEYSFAKNFGALAGEQILKCREILERDLLDSLQSGLNARKETVAQSEHITDPYFFYPLVGSIHALLNYFASNAKG